MQNELKQVEDAKGNPEKLRALAEKRFNPESAVGLSAAMEAAWEDPVHDPMTAFWGMQLAHKANDETKRRGFAFRAVANEDNYGLTHAVSTFLRTRDNDPEFFRELLAVVLRHDPYRVGALGLQASLVERLNHGLLIAKGLPLARLAQDLLPEDDRFVVLDAGATESKMATDYAAWSPDRWRVFGFDPSRNAVLAGDESNIIMSPIALGAREETIAFYETANSGASSIHPPETEFAKRILFNDQVKLSQSLEVVETYDVDVVDIDTWRERESIPAIDYLKINTQGAELEILKGSEQSLSDTLGVLVEVSFAGHYRNAPRFGDIDNFLTERGFCLFDIRKTNTYTRVRTRKSVANHLRPRTADYAWPSRQAYEAQILYLRDPTHPSQSDEARWMELRNWLWLATLGEMHGQLDYVVQLLEIVLNERSALLAGQEAAFAKRLDEIVDSYRQIEMRHY